MSRTLAPLFCLVGGCIPRLYTNGEEIGPWEAPVNTWGVNPPPEGLEGEGYDEGQIVPDFRLVDQHGDEVSLWQFFGDVVLLDISTIWCKPCQGLAADVEQSWADYRDDGFVYVTVLQEDLEGNPPDDADLDFWVDTFGITAPVLGDGEAVTLPAIRNSSFPAVLVIDRDLRVLERLGTTVEEVRAGIEAAL